MNITQFYIYWLKHRNDTLDELNSHACGFDEYCIVQHSFFKSWRNYKIMTKCRK